MPLFTIRHQIFRAVGLVLVIILLLFLFIDFEALDEAIRATDWQEYMISVAFLLATYAVITFRTRFLLQQKISYMDALSVDTSGFMFSILLQLPNSAFRALAMNRSAGIDGTLTTSALTVEVLTGWLVRSLGVVFAIVLVAADSGEAQRPLIMSVVTVGGIFLLLFLLAMNAEQIRPYLAALFGHVPRVSSERADQMASGTTHTLEHIASVRRFGVALILTILVWVLALLFYLYAFESMNIEITKPHLFVALAAMIVAPPTSPMMIGVFHGTVIAVIGTLALLDTNDAAAYAITIHTSQMLLLIILGFIGMRRLKLHFREIVKEIRESTRTQS